MRQRERAKVKANFSFKAGIKDRTEMSRYRVTNEHPIPRDPASSAVSIQ